MTDDDLDRLDAALLRAINALDRMDAVRQLPRDTDTAPLLLAHDDLMDALDGVE